MRQLEGPKINGMAVVGALRAGAAKALQAATLLTIGRAMVHLDGAKRSGGHRKAKVTRGRLMASVMAPHMAPLAVLMDTPTRATLLGKVMASFLLRVRRILMASRANGRRARMVVIGALAGHPIAKAVLPPAVGVTAPLLMQGATLEKRAGTAREPLPN